MSSPVQTRAATAREAVPVRAAPAAARPAAPALPRAIRVWPLWRANMASNMGSNMALQIETAIASAATNIRSPGSCAAAPLPLWHPQISDSSLAQAGTPQNGTFLLTIFLKHDESKTLDQI